MFNKLQKLSEFFNKKNRRALNSREDFSIEDENDTPDGLSIFLTVLVIVSLTFDILKHTQVYENNVMKHILNTNYVLSYGIGSLIKGAASFSLLVGLLKKFKELGENKLKLDEAKTKYDNNNEDTKNTYINALGDYNKNKKKVYMFALFSSVLLISLILDIIQFTPLMQNQYISNFVIMNTHAQTIGLIILKLIAPIILLN